MKKAMIVPPIAVGVGLIYFALSGKEAPERAEIAETATVVRVVTSTPMTFVPRVIGYGTVEPSRTLDAIAQVSGRVIHINPNFKRGDFIAEGEVIIKLAPEDYELEIAEAETDIASASVDLEELAVTLETQKKSLEISKAVLELEKKELERQKELLKRKVSSNQRVEDQEAVVLQKKSDVQDLENEIALNPVKKKALEQAKRKNEVRLETAQLNLERTTIKAPFDARVSEVTVEIDQFVSSGSSVGELDGVDAADIDVQISPANMSGFANLAFPYQLDSEEQVLRARNELDRLSAVVRVGSIGDTATWTARVKRVSDTVDPDTRSVGLIVSVDNPYDTLRPGIKPPLVKGMFTEVELSGEPLEGQTVLPRNAVLNGKMMTVTPENRLALSDAEVAYQFGDIVVLKSPLPEGTKVVISDVSPIIEGMLLKPVEDEVALAGLASAAGDSNKSGDVGK